MTHTPHSRFSSMITRHESALRKYAMQLTKDYDDANDLFQDTCMRGWRFWDQFKEGTNERGWMTRIMQNHFRNGFRRKRASPELVDYKDVYYLANPVFDQKESGVSDQISEALNRLSDYQRLLFLMVHLEDYSYEEMSSIFGIPKNTLRTFIHRSKMQMQQALS